MNIANSIKSLREKNGMTQKEFALAIGKSFSSVQKYEMGLATPPLKTLNKIAETFNISIYDFFDDREKSVMNTIRLFNFQDEYDQKIVEVSTKRMEYEYKMKGYSFSETEKRFIKCFNDLNSTGQQVAVARIEELTKIPDYQKQEEPPQSE